MFFETIVIGNSTSERFSIESAITENGRHYNDGHCNERYCNERDRK